MLGQFTIDVPKNLLAQFILSFSQASVYSYKGKFGSLSPNI